MAWLTDEKIPNNVNLSEDRKLQRALEAWQPDFVRWWLEVGPEGFQAADVWLRTAVSVRPEGWAVYDWVRMPEYRWGIFLADSPPDRRIGFGDALGQLAWQEVPGEHQVALRRLIVTQGDTEPASVEQQRLLGHGCPSLYDLRNLFQVNMEEGRHLWAMVYLLHGDADRPRILGAFNQPIEDWLDFFMFTTFTDRDGKYQLLALAESGFDPLARTTRFMLTEEAHHMFVGESGVSRVVRRSAELTRDLGDPRRQGGIELPLLQKYLNLWFSLSLDLFGGEISTNAASFFGAGLKGRAHEERFPDHRALDAFYALELPDAAGGLRREEVPLRNAMNEVLRDSYVEDCERAVGRWNRHLVAAGLPERLRLPSRRFHRQQGAFAGHRFDPEGRPLSEEQWEGRRGEWLPSEAERAYVRSLQARPVTRAGELAAWIAPPPKGIEGKPVEFEYVRTEA